MEPELKLADDEQLFQEEWESCLKSDRFKVLICGEESMGIRRYMEYVKDLSLTERYQLVSEFRAREKESQDTEKKSPKKKSSNDPDHAFRSSRDDGHSDHSDENEDEDNESEERKISKDDSDGSKLLQKEGDVLDREGFKLVDSDQESQKSKELECDEIEISKDLASNGARNFPDDGSQKQDGSYLLRKNGSNLHSVEMPLAAGTQDRENESEERKIFKDSDGAGNGSSKTQKQDVDDDSELLLKNGSKLPAADFEGEIECEEIKVSKEDSASNAVRNTTGHDADGSDLLHKNGEKAADFEGEKQLVDFEGEMPTPTKEESQ